MLLATVGAFAALCLSENVAAQEVRRSDSPAGQISLGTAGGKRIFALVVGVDDYKILPPLDGAVADARDIAGALRRGGVSDLTVLLDAAATRAAVTGTVLRFIREVRAGDLVIVSFAGHGSQDPARVRTQMNEGFEEVFMLAGFDVEGPATRERLIDREIYEWLTEFNAKGASVIFLADSCHSGGLTKATDPRIGRLKYRAVHRVSSKEEAAARPGAYFIADDQLARGAGAGEVTAPEELKLLTFIAAVDRKTQSPEVKVDNEPTPRGAISYAFARALEGMADADNDGRLSRRELIAFIRGKTHDLTERKQDPVFAPLDRFDDVLLTLGPQAGSAMTTARLPDAGGGGATTTAFTPARPVAPAEAVSRSGAFRLGVIGAMPPTASLGAAGSPFELVRPDAAGLDAVWDATRGDVVSSLGDIVARRVTAREIAGVVDRLAAVRKLAALSGVGQAQFVLAPDKRVFRNGERTNLKLAGVDGRYLIIVNISGNGKMQFVYPLTGDQPLVILPRAGAAKEIGDIAISAPFGSEVMIAITSRRRLTALEQQFVRLHDQQSARQVVELLAQLPPGEAEVSLLSFFTEP